MDDIIGRERELKDQHLMVKNMLAAVNTEKTKLQQEVLKLSRRHNQLTAAVLTMLLPSDKLFDIACHGNGAALLHSLLEMDVLTVLPEDKANQLFVFNPSHPESGKESWSVGRVSRWLLIA